MAEFADRSEAVLQGDVDEVLIVGHSSGAYIAISVPVIGLGVMATFTNLTTTGITFAAVMGSLAALALVLLIRRERAGGK